MTFDQALLAVESELELQCAELSGPMLEVCRFAVQGGRRVRAALLLGAGQQFRENAIRAASAIELIHAATLLQDDIFDSGLLRRGRTAAHVQFGKAFTILASDWLLIRSLEMAADLHPRFFRKLARAGAAMARAEAQELDPPVLRSVLEAQRYGLRIAEGKTAALFEAALCGAAIVQGLGVAESQSWEQIGKRVGLTYQIVDDCADVYGKEAVVRKSVGVDLARGCLTMPVFFAVSLLAQQGMHLSLAALQSGQVEPSERAQLLAALHSVEVQHRLSDLLEQRLAAHRSEAENAGIPVAVVDDCFKDLQPMLNLLQSTEPLDTATINGGGSLHSHGVERVEQCAGFA